MRDTHLSAMNRRTFLKGTGAAALGVGLLGQPEAWAEEVKKKLPLQKRTLGRTGMEVTDIAFGGIQIQHERLLDVAIDRGINYIHTASGYGGGKSIQLYGKVMKRRRKEVFLALKQNPIGGIDDQLKILNTEYVDVLVPPLHSVEAMKNPKLPGAYEKLKKEGKIRFSGYACHKNIADVMNLSVNLGFFDVMLIAYNLGNRAELDPILARARKEQKMGFMAMKTSKDLESGAHAAAFTSLLENENVDTLLVGMSNFAEVEQNAAVSGRETGFIDRLRLREYAHLPVTGCTMCGACEVGCPQGVAVADVLRYGMYAQRGERDLAVAEYGSLAGAQSVSACDGCGACEKACPRSRPVRRELRAIHAALS